MRLSNDDTRLAQEFGFDPGTNSLFTNIRRDSRSIAVPIIADDVAGENGPVLLVRQQESAGVLFAGVPPEKVRFHSEWIAFDRRIVAGIEVAENLAALVADLSVGDPVTLSPGICLAYAQQIEARVPVTIELGDENARPVTVVELSEAAVLERYRAWREQGVAFARDFAPKFPGLEGLEASFDATTDTRFTALAELADSQGLDALYLAAPPNFSEVTGQAHASGVGALWVPGTGRVLVIADDVALAAGADTAAEPGSAPISGTENMPGPVTFLGTDDAAVVGRYATRAEAIRDLTPGARIGVEEEWITAAFAQTLTAVGLELTNTSMALGSWRDLRDREDLPFVVIAARASTFAIENALTRLGEKLASGSDSTEAELYADYLAGLDEFTRIHEVPFAIEPYFVNLHASDRTLYPTTPTDAPITRDSGCVELDAGVQVGVDGVVLGTSDMGRSLPLTNDAEAAYDTLMRVIRERIIPSIRPGKRMSEVHDEAMESLTAVRGELEAVGLLAPDTDFVSWYKKRNVGHLMGKQESFANELRPGYTHVLRVGDHGAAEVPWRFGNIGISAEDLWFITEERTVNLTLSESPAPR